ncbi:MAG: septum formation initiator family protein [Candidatus Levybacteria bacterium]|nr:septum formation initiator family protein [Candidatus Levybacteria bacterium]
MLILREYSMKKIAYILVVFGLVLIINSLIHSIYNLWQKQDLVTSAQKELDKQKALNQKLKAQIEYAQTPQFIEQQAHDKLFLVRPDQQEVLFSDKPIFSEENISTKANIPNWRKWLNLFL